MNGMFSRGLVCACISLAVPVTARAQDETPVKTQEEAREEAAVTRAAEAAQLKAVVDQLQVKLQQARDEVQQALAQRDGQEQIADLTKQLESARAEAKQARRKAEHHRRELEKTLLKLKQHAAAVAHERDRVAAQQAKQAEVEAHLAEQLHNSDGDLPAEAAPFVRQARAVARLERIQAVQAFTNLTPAAGEVPAEPAANTAPEVALSGLIEAASQAFERAQEASKLAGILQNLRALGRIEEADQIEGQARELGIQLTPAAAGRQEMAPTPSEHKLQLMRAREALQNSASQPQDEVKQRLVQSIDAVRKEASGPGGIHRAIDELRGEVRQLREEVRGLRELLESRPAANQGAQHPLRREDLCHIRSRMAGEIVKLGTIEDDADDSNGRSIRAGDVVRKGQVLAVVCCDQISEKEYDLVEALQRLELDRGTAQRLKEAGPAVIPARQIADAQRAVSGDEITVERLERTLLAWDVDEADLAAICEHARQHRSDDDEADSEEQPLPWGQIKVLAPVDGVVLERSVSQGELVQLDALFILQAAESAGATPK